MGKLDGNTVNVSSEDIILSLNKVIKPPHSNTNLEAWYREFIKIKQCPQREDALENQLNDLCLVAEKLGMFYASHFIKNIKKK